MAKDAFLVQKADVKNKKTAFRLKGISNEKEKNIMFEGLRVH
jgi:hypothetical protein